MEVVWKKPSQFLELVSFKMFIHSIFVILCNPYLISFDDYMIFELTFVKSTPKKPWLGCISLCTFSSWDGYKNFEFERLFLILVHSYNDIFQYFLREGCHHIIIVFFFTVKQVEVFLNNVMISTNECGMVLRT